RSPARRRRTGQRPVAGSRAGGPRSCRLILHSLLDENSPREKSDRDAHQLIATDRGLVHHDGVLRRGVERLAVHQEAVRYHSRVVNAIGLLQDLDDRERGLMTHETSFARARSASLYLSCLKSSTLAACSVRSAALDSAFWIASRSSSFTSPDPRPWSGSGSPRAENHGSSSSMTSPSRPL